MERTNVAIRGADTGVRLAAMVALCLATHGCASGGRQRWNLTLDVIRDGIPQHSDYYLYVLSGYFVKLRITYRFTDARLALEQTFVAGLFTRLVPQQ